jgi:predicted GIY-YIG superfamily endonuclease
MTTWATGAAVAVEIDGDPTALYRLFDASGVLLYVGITRNIPVRFARHEAEKDWWPQVARKMATLYGSREDAEKAESAAIDTEAPVCNMRRGRQPVVPKRPPGRPKVGTQTCFTIPDCDLSVIDNIARREDVARSALLRGIIAAYVASQNTGELQ